MQRGFQQHHTEEAFYIYIRSTFLIYHSTRKAHALLSNGDRQTWHRIQHSSPASRQAGLTFTIIISVAAYNRESR